MLSAGIVDGVVGSVVAHELLVSPQAPCRPIVVLVREQNDANLAGLRQLGCSVRRDLEDRGIAQLGRKLDGVHV